MIKFWLNGFVSWISVTFIISIVEVTEIFKHDESNELYF